MRRFLFQSAKSGARRAFPLPSKPWLKALPWDKVLEVNQTFCQSQSTAHQPKAGNYEKVRALWQGSAMRDMSLVDVLELCRKCHEMAPFEFNNANTFAALGKNLLEDWLVQLPGLDAQIIRGTVAHYIAGQVDKQELETVLHHFNRNGHAFASLPADRTSLPPPFSSAE